MIMPGEDSYEVETKRKWFITQMDIPSGAQFNLKVKYLGKNLYTDWETSKSAFPAFGQRSFTYDFSNARHWGNGIVPNFSLQIDAKELEHYGLSLNFVGLDLQKKRGTYTFEAVDFDLNTAADLYLYYEIENKKG